MTHKRETVELPGDLGGIGYIALGPGEPDGEHGLPIIAVAANTIP